jgi:hypothetical protein
MKESEIFQEVRSARQKDPFAYLDNDRQGETVICHTKDIVLNADLFQKAFAGLPKANGLNDIIRYDIYRYLRKMDDPVEENLLLHTGKLEVVQSQKVYHINFVSQYSSTSFRNEKIYKRMRLVLNRLGLKRIEHIPIWQLLPLTVFVLLILRITISARMGSPAGQSNAEEISSDVGYLGVAFKISGSYLFGIVVARLFRLT